MPKYIDWIDNKKTSTYVIFISLGICYGIVYLFPNCQWVASIALLGSILFPFTLFLIWVIDSELIRRLLNRRWTAVLFTGVVVTYGMFANTFSNDLINELFRVDPAHFTVTRIFLTTTYLLVGIFQPFVVLPVSIAVLLLGGVVLFALLFIGTGKQVAKRIVVFLFGSLAITASAQTLGLLQNGLPRLTELVALRSDFNEHHRCTAKWSVRVDKVVFLHDGNVLGHIAGARSYQILPCRAK